ncbi:MAG: hypothetical protein LC754_04780 [Acidobacteria bacterium]|nr:hypothetical protein [Acidobacteriota bacterium]
MMGENKEGTETKAVQTDRESQEYGSQHGQDTQGHETGSSSPTASAPAETGAEDEKSGDGTGSRAGEYS